jgi:hypothetical protein
MMREEEEFLTPYSSPVPLLSTQMVRADSKHLSVLHGT